MGFYFCRSHWYTLPLENVEPSYRETPCFQQVKSIYKAIDGIHTRIYPTTIDHPHYGKLNYEKGEIDKIGYSKLTKETMERYIQDVLELGKGFIKRTDEYEFEYPLRTDANFMKFSVFSCLLRACEEYWTWIERYLAYVDEGWSKDLAFLFMAFDGQNYKGSSGVGHWWINNLSRLKSLRDFSMAESVLKPLETGKVDFSNPYNLWHQIQVAPWFHSVVYLPNMYKLTKETYPLFLEDMQPLVRQQRIYALIGQQKYAAIAA